VRWLLLCLLAACQFTPGKTAGGASGDDGGTDSSIEPDAAIDAPACASTCQSSTMILDCTSNTAVECPLGCTSDPSGDRCAWPTPSNGADMTHLAGVTKDLTITANTTLETDLGTINVDGTVTFIRSPGLGLQNGMRFTLLGSGVVVLGVKSLTVQQNARLRIAGSHPVIILSAGDILIEGLVDASANLLTCSAPTQRQCGGPGGGTGGGPTSTGGGCTGGGAGFNGSGDETGGGGGGYGTPAGGSGGAGDNLGGAGGAGNCSTQEVVPLVGGSGGGGGGNGGVGGGGGGALQLSALGSILVRTPSSATRAGIRANGAGGAEGGLGTGGGGGGSAGAILLEGQKVTIDAATLTANAGGGGGGNSGGDGSDGRFDDQGASGGTNGRAGGTGASRNSTPGNGTGGGDGTGGGGGGIGRIFINSGNGYYVLLNGALVSPVEYSGVPPAM